MWPAGRIFDMPSLTCPFASFTITIQFNRSRKIQLDIDETQPNLTAIRTVGTQVHIYQQKLKFQCCNGQPDSPIDSTISAIWLHGYATTTGYVASTELT